MSNQCTIFETLMKNITPYLELLKSFPLVFGTKGRCSLFSYLCIIRLDVLAKAVNQRNRS